MKKWRLGSCMAHLKTQRRVTDGRCLSSIVHKLGDQKYYIPCVHFISSCTTVFLHVAMVYLKGHCVEVEQ